MRCRYLQIMGGNIYDVLRHGMGISPLSLLNHGAGFCGLFLYNPVRVGGG